MGADGREYGDIAEWYARDSFRSSDAQNVEREAYAEEREAYALERELLHPHGLPVPTLRDLLTSLDVTIRMCTVQLDKMPADWGDRQTVTDVQTAAQKSAQSVRKTIDSHHNTAQDGVKPKK
jgi:hypothetical protein